MQGNMPDAQQDWDNVANEWRARPTGGNSVHSVNEIGDQDYQ
jgi:hypothetical protein